MVRSAGEGEWGGKGYYTIALTPRQYRSHMERNRGWPPRSQLLTHPFRNQLFAPAKKKSPLFAKGKIGKWKGEANHFKVTWPFCTRFILNPTVGIELE